MTHNRRSFLKAVAAIAGGATVVSLPIPTSNAAREIAAEGIPDLYSGGWHNVVITNDYGKVAYYIDNVEIKGDVLSGPDGLRDVTISPRPSRYSIVRRVNLKIKRISDLRVFEKALTKEDVAVLYERPQDYLITRHSIPIPSVS